MISIANDKTLNIILPNINKALAVALKSASANQLKQLEKHSDIKSTLSSLFNEKISTNKSDKIILDILKNSPVFKEMGSVSKDIILLQKLLKSIEIPKKIKTSFDKFIKKIENIDTKLIKSQIDNSGIFLESKLAKPTNTNKPIKELIKELQTILEKKPNIETKKIEQLLEPIVKNKNLTPSAKELTLLKKEIEKIVSSLEATHETNGKSEIKELTPILTKIEKNIKPKILEIKLSYAKELLVELEALQEDIVKGKATFNPEASDVVKKTITIVKLAIKPKLQKNILLIIEEEIKKVVEQLSKEEKKELIPIIEKIKQSVQTENVKIILPELETLLKKIEKSETSKKDKSSQIVKKTILTIKSNINIQKNILPIVENEIKKISEKLTPKELKDLKPLLDEIKENIKITKFETLIPQLEKLQKRIKPIQIIQKQQILDVIKDVIAIVKVHSQTLSQSPQKTIANLDVDFQIKLPKESIKELQQIIFDVPQKKDLHVQIKRNLENIIFEDKNKNIKTLISNFSELYIKLEEADIPQKMQTFQTIEKIVTSLRSAQSPEIEKNTTLNIKKEIQKIIEMLPKEEKNELKIILEAVKENTNYKEIKALPQKIEIFLKTLEQKEFINKSEILHITQKIINIVQKLTQPITPINTLENIEHEVVKMVHKLKSTTEKLDQPILEELQHINEKLNQFTKSNANIAKFEMDERLANDIKANLLQLSEEIKQNPQLQHTNIEKLVDKLTIQIDYYQLYSHLNNSSSLYFPFMWEQLNNGSVSIKKRKKDKFYCEIHLKLKDYGDLDLMLSLYNKNQINLQILSQSSELKNIMREHLNKLRTAFSEANLMLREINFFQDKQNKSGAYKDFSTEVESGFEVIT